MTELTKKCSKCGEVKGGGEFYKRKVSSDGLNSWCKKCLLSTQKQYRKTVPEKIRVNNRKYRMKNLKNERRYQRWYCAKNRLKMRARDRECILILGDRYIKTAIKKQTGLPAKGITPEMIELKRQQLTLYRLIKQQEKEINDGLNDR